jgi:hypothetical protein
LLSGAWGVLLGGFLLAAPLRPLMVDWLGIGQNPFNAQRNQDPTVAILDGGQMVYQAPLKYEVRVRVEHHEGPASRVQVGLIGPDIQIGPAEAELIQTAPDHSYFKGTVDVPYMFQGKSDFQAYPFVQVQTAAGLRNIYGASQITVRSMRHVPEHWIVPILMILGMSALFLSGPRVLTVAIFCLMGYWCFDRGLVAIAPGPTLRSEFLPAIPAVESIKSDKDLFRIFSFDEHLFGPELSSCYGIEDFRTWDATDVLEHIYYLRLLGISASQHRPDITQKLISLANIKYVLARPNEQSPLPGLVERYRGELAVYSNPAFMPRALFLSDAATIPFDEFKDWRTTMGKGLPHLWSSLQHGLDPERTLLLHESSIPELPPSSKTDKKYRSESRAEITDYQIDSAEIHVEAPIPGYVFMSDTYFPGWKAYLDGQQVPILRAWLNFRAVKTPAGKHILKFFYRPLG